MDNFSDDEAPIYYERITQKTFIEQSESKESENGSDSEIIILSGKDSKQNSQKYEEERDSSPPLHGNNVFSYEFSSSQPSSLETRVKVNTPQKIFSLSSTGSEDENRKDNYSFGENNNNRFRMKYEIFQMNQMQNETKHKATNKYIGSQSQKIKKFSNFLSSESQETDEDIKNKITNKAWIESKIKEKDKFSSSESEETDKGIKEKQQKKYIGSQSQNPRKKSNINEKNKFNSSDSQESDADNKEKQQNGYLFPQSQKVLKKSKIKLNRKFLSSESQDTDEEIKDIQNNNSMISKSQKRMEGSKIKSTSRFLSSDSQETDVSKKSIQAEFISSQSQDEDIKEKSKNKTTNADSDNDRQQNSLDSEQNLSSSFPELTFKGFSHGINHGASSFSSQSQDRDTEEFSPKTQPIHIRSSNNTSHMKPATDEAEERFRRLVTSARKTFVETVLQGLKELNAPVPLDIDISQPPYFESMTDEKIRVELKKFGFKFTTREAGISKLVRCWKAVREKNDQQHHQKHIETNPIDFIRNQSKYYESILIYQPIPLAGLHREMTESGIKISVNRLRNILDEEGVAFSDDINSVFPTK